MAVNNNAWEQQSRNEQSDKIKLLKTSTPDFSTMYGRYDFQQANLGKVFDDIKFSINESRAKHIFSAKPVENNFYGDPVGYKVIERFPDMEIEQLIYRFDLIAYKSKLFIRVKYMAEQSYKLWLSKNEFLYDGLIEEKAPTSIVVTSVPEFPLDRLIAGVSADFSSLTKEAILNGVGDVIKKNYLLIDNDLKKDLEKATASKQSDVKIDIASFKERTSEPAHRDNAFALPFYYHPPFAVQLAKEFPITINEQLGLLISL